MLTLPDHVRDRMLAVHGDEGRQWLDDLPRNLEAIQRAWRVALGPPFPNLSYAYVAEAMRADGTEAVLKAQPPHLESFTEAMSLREWDGQGIVRVYETEADHGLLLLERLRPGFTAEAIDDDEATRALGEVMVKLWRPEERSFLLDLETWGRELFEYPETFAEGGPLPLDLVMEAIATYREMLATSPEPRLLHGDLHHGNILSATRAPWLAIDPKGVVGDPAFEPSAMFFNPHPRLAVETDIPSLVARRLAIICEVTGLDRRRVAAWGFARAMLSLCWSATSGSPVAEPTLAVARALQDLM